MLVRRQLQPLGNAAGQRVDIADEVGHELGGGVIVHLVGRADLLDIALVEHGDSVGEGQRLLLIVGDVDGGDAELPLHLFQLVAQLYAQLGVQIGKRLVHADDGRLHHQRAGDGHALLLAAGELADRLGQLLVAQIHLFGDGVHLFRDLRLAQLFDLQTEGNVVPHGHRGEQRVALEHDADVALFDGHVGDVLALHPHRAADRLDKAGDGAQRGGLAAAGGAEEGEKLALLHMDVDVVQRLEIVKFDHDIR